METLNVFFILFTEEEGGGRSEHQRSNIMVGLLRNKETDPELEPTMPVNINIKLSLSGDQLKIIHYVIRDFPLPTLAATKAILTFFATWITCCSNPAHM